jgi:SAM-dependent methyltransferase
MSFLIHAPERVLALRLALSRVITSTSVVLDAGCGSLGLLAVMAAKLGAARVIGVDLGAVELATALAEENGVADRVQFLRGDLHSVELPVERFDVIVGMVYNNEIKSDLGQQRLMASLVQRFGHAGTAVVPNKVRYAAAGYDLRVDGSSSTRVAEWTTHIVNVERQAGVTFAGVRQMLDQTGTPALTATGNPLAGIGARWSRHLLRRPLLQRNRLRFIDRSHLMLLTRQIPFAEVDYASPATANGYPSIASLPVTRPGRLNVVVWQQDLVFDDLLIRSTESVNVVDAPEEVAPGDTAILSTGDRWDRTIPLVISRASQSPPAS